MDKNIVIYLEFKANNNKQNKTLILDNALRLLGLIYHHLSFINYITCTILKNSLSKVLLIDSQSVTLAFTHM